MQNLHIFGDLLGNINVPVGNILNSLLVDGAIGTPANPVSINTRDTIGTITAGEVNATIDTNAFGVNSTIKSLSIVNDFGGSGNFSGSLVTQGIEDITDAGITVEGDMNGSITLNTALPSTREIRIGGSLAVGASINVPAAGLAGQIVVNNNAAGGLWNGTVNVGAVALTDPSYTNAAASLGNGASGLAPFNLHGSSCIPFDGQVVNLGMSGTGTVCDPNNPPQSITQAVVRHYGPVDFPIGVQPLTILTRPFGSTGAFVDITRQFFVSKQVGSGDRALVITHPGMDPEFPPNMEYQILPVAAVLKSVGVAGNIDVASYEFNFSLVSDCELFDMNGNGVVSASDITAWSASPVDLNGDNIADSADFAAVVTAVNIHGHH